MQPGCPPSPGLSPQEVGRTVLRIPGTQIIKKRTKGTGHRSKPLLRKNSTQTIKNTPGINAHKKVSQKTKTGRSPSSRLLMIFPPCLNLKRPVQLLQQHHPCQLMGEGHLRHGQPQIRPLLDPLRQPEGTADHQGHRALPLYPQPGQQPCKRLAFLLLPLNAQGDPISGACLLNGTRLRLQSLGDLISDGIVKP